jgi:hypothetical protein
MWLLVKSLKNSPLVGQYSTLVFRANQGIKLPVYRADFIAYFKFVLFDGNLNESI